MENLEYMEAEFYLRATAGKGISDAEAGSEAASVIGGHEAKFENKAIREFVEELAENELAHVRFCRKTLGRSAISRPAIEFEAGFKAAAQAAGLPADFDPPSIVGMEACLSAHFVSRWLMAKLAQSTLANKLARIAWSILRNEKTFDTLQYR